MAAICCGVKILQMDLLLSRSGETVSRFKYGSVLTQKLQEDEDGFEFSDLDQVQSCIHIKKIVTELDEKQEWPS